MKSADDLRHHAEKLAATYRRHTWYRFVLVFFPVPFVIVLVRLHLEAWHYYVAGAAYLLFSAALYSYDSRASDKVAAAAKAAEQADKS